MPGLMDMPAEIRYQILELCLVVEGTINPYPALHEGRDQFAKCNRKPDVALLKVNKVLNLEATRTIYSMNTWQLSSPRPLVRPQFAIDLIWLLHCGRIFHLRMVMDIYDIPPNTILNAAREADERSLEGDQRMTFVHDRCLRDTEQTIRWKMVMVTSIQPLKLEIDIKNMYCPTGCCRDELIKYSGRRVRKIVARCDELRAHGHSTGLRTDLNVVGLVKGEERNLIRKTWKQDLEVEADEELVDWTPQFTIEW